MTRERKWMFFALGVAFISVLAVLALCAMAYRPAAVLGVGGKALNHSVRRTTSLGSPSKTCTRRLDDLWRCDIYDRGESSAVVYEVETRGLGCWDATRVGKPGSEGGTPKTASGCIDGFDLLRPVDRILD